MSCVNLGSNFSVLTLQSNFLAAVFPRPASPPEESDLVEDDEATISNARVASYIWYGVDMYSVVIPLVAWYK